MKKIFIFLFVLIVLSCTSFKLKANDEDAYEGDIIAEIGCGIDSMLLTPGVKMVSGKVDWNKVGDYEVVCTKENNDFFLRKVLVREEGVLSKGIDLIKDVGILGLELKGVKEVLSFNSYPLNDKEYFAYYNYLTTNNNKNAVICKYKTGEPSKNYYIEGNSEVADMCIYGEYLYAFITIYENGFSKIQLCKFDLNLNLVSSHRFNSNVNDEAKSLYEYNDYLYLFLNTSSNEGIINRSASNKIALILKIDPLNYVISDYKELGNNYDNELIETNFSDNVFTLLINLNGSNGKFYHSLNKSYSGYFLINLNVNLEASILKNLEDEFMNNSEINFNSKQTLAVWKENINKISIKYGIINKEKSVSIAAFSKEITAISSFILNEEIYILVSLNNQLSKIIHIKDENIEIRNVTNVSYNCINAYVYNKRIYLFCESDQLRLFSFERFNISKYTEKIEEINIQKINVYINNIIEKCDIDNEISNVNYGSHYSLSSAITRNYLILFKAKYIVPLKINIRNNEVYDPGLILEFNGAGKLNNNIIESGFCVNDIGKYQLEITGENSEKTIINFEILDKCVKEYDGFMKKDLTLEYMGYENGEINDMNYDVYTSETSYKGNTDFEFFIIVIVMLIIFIAILLSYLRKNIRRRQSI